MARRNSSVYGIRLNPEEIRKLTIAATAEGKKITPWLRALGLRTADAYIAAHPQTTDKRKSQQ
jgi:beta-lactamase superfamily II metal-dependent hydrolase